MPTLTARDVAEKIKRPGESLSAAISRLRNWAAVGLINPVGGRHPGTGRHRRYTPNAARDAILLQILTDRTRLPAIDVEPLLRVLKKHLGASDTGYFLMISGSPGSERWSISSTRRSYIEKELDQSEHGVHIILDVRKIDGLLGLGNTPHTSWT
jgi:hypothetical protein